MELNNLTWYKPSNIDNSFAVMFWSLTCMVTGHGTEWLRISTGDADVLYTGLSKCTVMSVNNNEHNR